MQTDTTVRGFVAGFARLPAVGEVYAERNGPTRGRWWIDGARYRNSVEMWVGRSYICLTIDHPRTAACVASILALWSGMETLGIVDLI